MKKIFEAPIILTTEFRLTDVMSASENAGKEYDIDKYASAKSELSNSYNIWKGFGNN